MRPLPCSLAFLVHRVPDNMVEQILTQLCVKVTGPRKRTSTNSDAAGIGLKAVVMELPSNRGDLVTRATVPALMQGLQTGKPEVRSPPACSRPACSPPVRPAAVEEHKRHDQNYTKEIGSLLWASCRAASADTPGRSDSREQACLGKPASDACTRKSSRRFTRS